MRKSPFAGIFLLTTLLPACSILVESPPDPDEDSGGDGGEVGPELPPPPDEFGVVLAPRTGDVLDDHEDADRLTVRGLYTRAGVALTIEAKVDGAWAPIAETTSATVIAAGGGDDEPRFAFEVTVDASPVWPQADLLHLRVRAGDSNVLVGFFADADTCFEAWPTWRERAQHCGSVYVRSGIVIASTDLGSFTQLAANERFLDDKGAITPEQTAAYYQAIGAPATLSEFRTRYVPEELVAAAYYNAGDLGIGRDMHCGTFPAATGTGVGCYVSNYGEFGGSRDVAEDELVDGVVAGDGLGSFATVAMVYTPPIEAPNAIQFIVYGPGQTLALEAELDTHGDNAAIPNNCLNCHGSTEGYDADTLQVTGARFLPFDPQAFHFVDRAGFRRADQEEDIRQLNALVATTEPAYASMEWLQGMYGGNLGVAGTVADTAWVASGWEGESASQIYTHAVAPFCRSCHGSRDDAGGPEVWDFSDHDRFLGAAPIVSAVVCGGGNDNVHRMPNAEVTQRAFWRSPARAYLGAMLDLGACAP